jgi:hypothetical protein
MKIRLIHAMAMLAFASQFTTAPLQASGYVAHEWGTFTSVQGADGIPIEWNPLVVSELPTFVYDLVGAPGRDSRLVRFFPAKSGFRTLQRMETPVIYFYGDSPLTISTEVKFPNGIITEWYPQANPLPRATGGALPTVRRELKWQGIRLLPDKGVGKLVSDSSSSHYYAARETDANLLAIRTPEGQEEIEKFLFYRGVGNFRAPLVVSMSDDEREITVRNDGSEEIGHAFIYRFQDGNASFRAIGSLPAGTSTSIRLPRNENPDTLAAVRTRLGDALRTALVEGGLYEKEAAAMVKTWDDSWLAEPGVRVLYTLPQTWTDRVLPLRLEPRPSAIVRVMVGRAELITPRMELALLREALRYLDETDSSLGQAVANVRNLGLGRFLEPAVRRMVAAAPKSREFGNRSWELLEAASKVPINGEGGPVAAK